MAISTFDELDVLVPGCVAQSVRDLGCHASLEEYVTNLRGIGALLAARKVCVCTYAATLRVVFHWLVQWTPSLRVVELESRDAEDIVHQHEAVCAHVFGQEEGGDVIRGNGFGVGLATWLRSLTPKQGTASN